jgi:hypothetical protein
LFQQFGLTGAVFTLEHPSPRALRHAMLQRPQAAPPTRWAGETRGPALDGYGSLLADVCDEIRAGSAAIRFPFLGHYSLKYRN